MHNQDKDLGGHYRNGKIEVWNVIWLLFGRKPFQANILKYIVRYPFKGTPLQDLRKCKDYIEFLIAREEDEQNDDGGVTHAVEVMAQDLKLTEDEQDELVQYLHQMLEDDDEQDDDEQDDDDDDDGGDDDMPDTNHPFYPFMVSTCGGYNGGEEE